MKNNKKVINTQNTEVIRRTENSRKVEAKEY